MRCRPFTVAVLALVFTGGCINSTNTKAGLSNVHAKEWDQARAINGSDTIANGDDSCERPGGRRPDPMPLRLYSCPGSPPEGTRVATPK